MKTFLTTTAVALIAATGATASTTTLHLTEKQTFQHYLDNGAKGESAGDVRIFGGPLFQGKKRVGHDRIRCVVGSRCSTTLWLPGGTLLADDVVVRPPSFTAAISRGTGDFVGVQGTATIVLGRVSRYTVRLTR